MMEELTEKLMVERLRVLKENQEAAIQMPKETERFMSKVVMGNEK